MDTTMITIPTIMDYRGNIAVVENDVAPFEIKRVYYLFDVPSSASRGGHAHKNLQQLLIPLSGSFDVILKDGKETQIVTLNKPDRGLLIRSNV
nr:WxcM-like domain-containing protein [Flavobacterium sp.]